MAEQPQRHLVFNHHTSEYYRGAVQGRPRWAKDINKAKPYRLIGHAKAAITHLLENYPHPTRRREDFRIETYRMQLIHSIDLAREPAHDPS